MAARVGSVGAVVAARGRNRTATVGALVLQIFAGMMIRNVCMNCLGLLFRTV